MRISKKIIALVLSVLMAISMMPFTAFAATTTEVADYNALVTAVNDAESGDTIKLTANIDASNYIYVSGKALTIDLAGYDINTTAEFPSNYALIYVGSDGDLTINDTKGSYSISSYNVTVKAGGTITAPNTTVYNMGGKFTLKKGVIKSTSTYAISNANNAVTTVAGGYVTAPEAAVLAACSNSTITVTGGYIETTDNAGIMLNGQTQFKNNTVNINGGYVIGKIVSEGYMAMGIYQPGDNTLNITKGTVVGVNGAGIVVRGGELNITGGTIIGQGNTSGKCGDARTYPTSNAIVVDTKAGYSDAANIDVNISGGTVKADIAPIGTFSSETVDADEKIAISGGTFTENGVAADVSEYYTAETAAAFDNGEKYINAATGAITTGTPGASIERGGETLYYPNIISAFTNATEGETAVALKNHSTTAIMLSTITKADNVTVDLNGFTITNTQSASKTMDISGGHDVTFINGTINSNIWLKNGTTLTIGEGCVLNGYITNNATIDFNTTTNIYGTVNGQIYQHVQGGVLNVYEGAEINADTPIHVKAGTVNIYGGTITATGEYKEFVASGSNGASTGAAILIEHKDANSGYGDQLDVNIYGGTITAANNVAVQSEAGGSAEGATAVDDVIPYNSTATFSSDVSDLAEEGYKTELNAETGLYEVVADPTVPVAMIGDVEYASLAEAITAANAATADGDVTITLCRSTTVNSKIYPSPVKRSSKINFDLGGHTLDLGANGYVQVNGDKLAFYNGTITGTTTGAMFEVYAHDSYPENFSTLELGSTTADLTVTNTVGSIAGIWSIGNVTSNGANISCYGVDNTLLHAKSFPLFSNGNIKAGGDGSINVYDHVTVISDTANAVYNAGATTTNINGGTLEGPTAIYIKAGALNVNGGTITATGAKSDYQYNGNGSNNTGDAIVVDNCGYPGSLYAEPPIDVNINAGTIVSDNADAVASYVKNEDYEQVDDIIPGDSEAKFSSDVSSLAQDGYITTQGQDGKYGVVKPANEANLKVAGDVALNFALALDTYGDALDHVEISYSQNNDKTYNKVVETLDKADFTPGTGDAAGKYLYMIDVAPAQITEKVQIKFVDANGVVMDELAYSVYDYCQYVIANINDAELVNLAKSICDYGSAAQDAFAWNNSGDLDVANTYLDYDSIDAPASKFANNSALTVTGIRIECIYNTNVRVYYTGDVETATCGEYTVNVSSDQYGNYIEIVGVKANAISDALTVTINGADTLTVAADTWARATIRANSNATDVKLAKALVNYGNCAKAYFG